MTTYATTYGVLDTAKRLSDTHGLQGAEWKATDYARMHARGSEARDFWMRVAQIVAEVRADVEA